MNKYTINYGFGYATLYTPSPDWKGRFYSLAEQCFGIRKSIAFANLCKAEKAEPKWKLVGEYERLEHNGDVIVWDEAGEKIKSEWDF